MMSQWVRSCSVFLLFAFVLVACGGETSPSGGDNGGSKYPQKEVENKPPVVREVMAIAGGFTDPFAYRVQIRDLNSRPLDDEELFNLLRNKIINIQSDELELRRGNPNTVYNKTQNLLYIVEDSDLSVLDLNDVQIEKGNDPHTRYGLSHKIKIRGYYQVTDTGKIVRTVRRVLNIPLTDNLRYKAADKVQNITATQKGEPEDRCWYLLEDLVPAQQVGGGPADTNKTDKTNNNPSLAGVSDATGGGIKSIRWIDRFKAADTLVIGSCYTATELTKWTAVDKNYIGIGVCRDGVLAINFLDEQNAPYPTIGGIQWSPYSEPWDDLTDEGKVLARFIQFSKQQGKKFKNIYIDGAVLPYFTLDMKLAFETGKIQKIMEPKGLFYFTMEDWGTPFYWHSNFNFYTKFNHMNKWEPFPDGDKEFLVAFMARPDVWKNCKFEAWRPKPFRR